MSFKGQTAIVTGAASGMGLAASKTLRAAGANVVMCDVNEVALAAGEMVEISSDVSGKSGFEKAGAGTLVLKGNLRGG